MTKSGSLRHVIPAEAGIQVWSMFMSLMI